MDDRLAFYEREWNTEHSKRIELQKQLGEVGQQLAELQRQNTQLRSQVEQLTDECYDLEEKLRKHKDKSAQLEQSHLEIEQRFQQLRQSIAEPDFWLKEFAVPLARELELFDALPEVARSYASGDPTDFALEAAQLISELEDSFDTEKVTRLRRMLIAQWVYARWLEVTSLSTES